MRATTVAVLLCVCSCVGALKYDEQRLPDLQFWSAVGNNRVNRRDAPSEDVKPVANDTSVKAKEPSSPVPIVANETVANEKPGKSIDFGKPGVLKRGLLVFGGFGLLAAAYFVFYKRRQKRAEGDGAGNPSDGPQFRYGVLQTDERMELSRMPLTMDSEDDDEEDLEIFDFGRRGPARAPPAADPDAVRDILAAAADGDREHLLLDIEDHTAATVVSVAPTKPADVI